MTEASETNDSETIRQPAIVSDWNENTNFHTVSPKADVS